jgi:uncharacterized protein YjbI with pentapeptide repeats
MANPEHVKILNQGVGVWNKCREENPDIIPDLKNADLQGINLSGAKLFEANISGAKLIRTDLAGADLSKSNLIGAHLSEGYLNGRTLKSWWVDNEMTSPLRRNGSLSLHHLITN